MFKLKQQKEPVGFSKNEETAKKKTTFISFKSVLSWAKFYERGQKSLRATRIKLGTENYDLTA